MKASSNQLITSDDFHWDEFLESLDSRRFPSINPVTAHNRVAPCWQPIIEGEEIIEHERKPR